MSTPNSVPNDGLHDLLLLATSSAASGIADEIALHFYTGFADLIKLQVSLNCDVQRLWACAEWIRLLFDANAIWIRDPSNKFMNEAGDTVSEVASLTSDEKEKLRRYLWTTEKGKDLKVCRCGPAIWLHFTGDRSLGDEVAGLDNSNLANVHSLFRIKVDRPAGGWEMVLLLPGGKGSAGERRAEALCSWVVGGEKGSHCNALVKAFRILPILLHQKPEKPNPFWSFDREKLAKSLKDLDREDFLTKYEHRLWAIDGLLQILQSKLSDMVGELIGNAPDSRAAIFSYRMPYDEYIAFLPTAKQAREFVTSKEEIPDFLEFFKFQYPRDRALSGWVLSTAMCDYTENFDKDGRWETWKKEGDPRIKEQLRRVGKFLQGEKDSENAEQALGKRLSHVYLVPLMTVPKKRNGKIALETMLMVSISVADPLPVAIRMEIFRLILELRTALNLALDVQKGFDQEREDVPTGMKPEPKVTLATIGTALSILVVLAGFGGWLRSYLATLSAPGQVRLAQNAIALSALTIVAQNDGDYQKHNLTVDVHNYSSGLKALAAIENGQSDIATVAETPVVLAAFDKRDIALVATIATSSEEMGLVVRTDKIHSPHDLKGMTLGVTKETNAHYFLDKFLTQNGMKMKDVTLVSEQPQIMADSFGKGRIDGYATWQPFVDAGLAHQELSPFEYPGSNFYTMTFNIVTTKKFLKEHHREVENFVRALKDAEVKVQGEPEQAKEAISEAESEAAKKLNGASANEAGKSLMDRATLDKLWDSYTFQIGLSESLLKEMDDQRLWVKTSGAFGYAQDDNPDFCNVIDSQILKAVDSKSVSIHCR